MASVDLIGSLLAEAAAPADLDAVLQHGEDGEWDLVFGDGRVVEATLLEDAGLLVLETELGVPATADRAALHRSLLEYNYLWRETGGLRVALDAPASSAFLSYALPAAGPDATLMANVLANFHAAATAWTARLAQADPGEGDRLPPGLFFGALRA